MYLCLILMNLIFFSFLFLINAMRERKKQKNCSEAARNNLRESGQIKYL